MIEELEQPCPWCGCCEVVIGVKFKGVHGRTRYQPKAICWQCVTPGPTAYGDTKEEAMVRARARWNTRGDDLNGR